jgi:hypothetical protein
MIVRATLTLVVVIQSYVSDLGVRAKPGVRVKSVI